MDAPQDAIKEGLTSIEVASSLAELEEVRLHWLGKKGFFTDILKKLGALPPEARKEEGRKINLDKAAFQEAFERKKTALQKQALAEEMERNRIDVTLPPRFERTGKLHPVSHVIARISALFAEQGFVVAEGPEIEDDDHNFTALNFPAHHPARQMHDTFFLKGAEGETPKLLRTHTSPVQIRAMRAGKPPFRVIAPGKTYRCDSDMTHTPMFHQVEGFVIDRAIHMGHLKACLVAFLQRFFEMENVPVRFRPSFFPFTEPSAEVDIGCVREQGGLRIGAGSDWLEVLGCGMVHPNVLREGGLDPEEWQGFAFGMGVERLAMLKYAIPDLREFFESDLRWLAHYGFGAAERHS
jgi:phenylalanyl-tRNA synthetase alpha chain